MDYVIIFLVCIVVNIAVNLIFFYHKPSDKDVYRIDIYDLDELSKKKEIVLKVDNNANLSQD